jgi:hypothetical protein
VDRADWGGRRGHGGQAAGQPGPWGEGAGPARDQGARAGLPADHLRPGHTLPENLARLQDRSLGRKRSLALREYALGIEALDRVVSGEPLWRVHETVFGVLALESEPVDPRL